MKLEDRKSSYRHLLLFCCWGGGEGGFPASRPSSDNVGIVILVGNMDLKGQCHKIFDFRFFKNQFPSSQSKFAAGVFDTGGKFATVVVAFGGKFAAGVGGLGEDDS